MTDAMEERFAVLEQKIMHQEETIQELSDILNKQWRDIELIQRKLTTAQDRLMSLEDSLPASGSVEKPPHY